MRTRAGVGGKGIEEDGQEKIQARDRLFKEELSRELFAVFKSWFGGPVMSRELENIKMDVFLKIWILNRFSVVKTRGI